MGLLYCPPMTEPTLSIVLEFARTDSPEDPYAFQFGPQSYTLRSSSGGRKRVHLDWSDDFLDDLQELAEPRCDPAVVQRVGRQLSTFLEPAGWTWSSREIVTAVQQSRPVHLTIRSAAAEIYAVPWELLTLEGTGQCVGEIPGLLVRYEWPETTTTPPRARPGAGRILVAWSSASAAVPADEHIAAIESAAKSGNFDFDRGRDVVANATLGKVADALERAVRRGEPIAALHILCHGGAAGETYGLMFDGETSGSAVPVDAQRLRQLLSPYGGMIRMVVLAACDSANSRGLFDSVALALHRTGIQAVVASRFRLSVVGSISLANTLYRSMLVQGESLEQASLQARRNLARDATKLDWASLQLYARRVDGHDTHPFAPIAGTDEDTMSLPKVEDSQSELIKRIEYGRLEMEELVELRDRAAGELLSRFQRTLALVSIDLKNSAIHTAAAGGDQSLLERCRMLVEKPVGEHGGWTHSFRASETRLDLCFPSVGQALDALFAVTDAGITYNHGAKRENLIAMRIGLHYGPVFTNGNMVVGEAVDAAARIAAAADGNVLWMSKEALAQATPVIRVSCNPVLGSEVISDDERLALFWLPLRVETTVPDSVHIVDTGEDVILPKQDIISFGRLDKLPDGSPANDVCLTMRDRESQLVISRWHFEIRRSPKSGYVVRVISSQDTEVDGMLVKNGDEAPFKANTVVRLARKVTLRFKSTTYEPPTSGMRTVMT